MSYPEDLYDMRSAPKTQPLACEFQVATIDNPYNWQRCGENAKLRTDGRVLCAKHLYAAVRAR